MKNLCKFRCRSHHLPVNNGRFIEVMQAGLKCKCAKVVMLVTNITKFVWKIWAEM